MSRTHFCYNTCTIIMMWINVVLYHIIHLFSIHSVISVMVIILTLYALSQKWHTQIVETLCKQHAGKKHGQLLESTLPTSPLIYITLIYVTLNEWRIDAVVSKYGPLVNVWDQYDFLCSMLSLLCSSRLNLFNQKYRRIRKKLLYCEILLQFKIRIFYFNML